MQKKINHINHIFFIKIFIFILAICFLMYFTYSNFFCIEILGDARNFKKKFYVLDTPLKQKLAKILFSLYLSFLELMINEFICVGNGDFFYPQNFFNEKEFALFNAYINYLKQDPRTTKAMLNFLFYIENLSIVHKNFKYSELRELFGPFLKDYISNYEKEWHSSSLKKELAFWRDLREKKRVTSPISGPVHTLKKHENN